MNRIFAFLTGAAAALAATTPWATASTPRDPLLDALTRQSAVAGCVSRTWEDGSSTWGLDPESQLSPACQAFISEYVGSGLARSDHKLIRRTVREE